MSTPSSSGSENNWSLLRSAWKKWRPLWWDFIVKYGPGIAVVIGAFWTAGTWVYQRSDQFRSEEGRRQQALEVARRESQKPFLERQLTLYFEAAKVTGVLGTRSLNEDEWSSARKRFWELYTGELSVVESPDVAEAMITLGETLRELGSCVDGLKDKSQFQPCNDMHKGRLQIGSITLAHRIRESIEAGWGYQLPALPPKK